MSTKLKLAFSSAGYLLVCWHCVRFHGGSSRVTPELHGTVAAALISAAPPRAPERSLAALTRDSAVALPASPDASVEAAPTPTPEPAPSPAPPRATRALIETPAALQSALDAAIAGRSVDFVAGGDALTPPSRAVLDDVAAVLVATPRWHIEVQGHTDNAGTAVECRERGARRAALVAQYLADRAVPLRRLIVLGVGASHPVADNATEEGRRLNRRIRFFVRARP